MLILWINLDSFSHKNHNRTIYYLSYISFNNFGAVWYILQQIVIEQMFEIIQDSSECWFFAFFYFDYFPIFIKFYKTRNTITNCWSIMMNIVGHCTQFWKFWFEVVEFIFCYPFIVLNMESIHQMIHRLNPLFFLKPVQYTNIHKNS